VGLPYFYCNVDSDTFSITAVEYGTKFSTAVLNLVEPAWLSYFQPPHAGRWRRGGGLSLALFVCNCTSIEFELTNIAAGRETVHAKAGHRAS
jgi:hypothetical protein